MKLRPMNLLISRQSPRFAALLLLCLVAMQVAAAGPPLIPEAPALIPDSHGKFDFIEFDSGTSRLLAAHPGNATLDVFDGASGKLIKHVAAGVAQDTAIDDKAKKYYVSISAGKKLATIDSGTLEQTAETPLEGPADIVCFDPKNGLAYVGHDDSAEVWVVDVTASKIIGRIAIPQGPEGILYDAVNDRVYINSKSGDVVVVVDPATNKAIATWPVAPATKPHGSALDAQGNRLFVVGANGKLVALDLPSGKVAGVAEVALRVDQIAFDPGLKRVYCASGEGVMSVVDASDGGLKSLGDAPTHKGAHSVAIDPKTHAVWTVFADGDKCYLLRLK